MSQHTPGPWAITSICQDESLGIGNRNLPYVIANVNNGVSFGEYIAASIRRGGGPGRPADAQTQWANARLIAAAPELLAFADWCLEHEGECLGDHPDKVDALQALVTRIRVGVGA